VAPELRPQRFGGLDALRAIAALSGEITIGGWTPATMFVTCLTFLPSASAT